MEDSFQARVDKVFGSLASSSSSTSTLSALWSLTDQEIEKREWNRDRDRDGETHDASPEPQPLDDGFFTQQSQAQIRISKFADFEDLEDHEEPFPDEKKKRTKHGPHSTQVEDVDIRSSIGLDCTLDYEEEEDEYDKVAVGREKAGDRIYMRDIAGYYGTDDNSDRELPSSFKNVARDPRANHMAAKLRLTEDAETAGNFDSLKLSEVATPPAKKAQGNQLDNGVSPKPILKRKETSQGGRSSKHVRFEEEFVGSKDPGKQSSPVEGTTSQEGADELPRGEAKTTSEAFSLPRDSTSMDDTASLGKASTSSVPDYVRFPSRYTRYTLDSSDDMDDESNRRAYMDFLNLLKKPHATEHSESFAASSPKSLIYTPKKKANDTSGVRKDNEFKQNLADISNDKPFPIGIAAGCAEDCGSEICPMEEDKPDIVDDKSGSSQKPGRRYRTRSNVECDDHVIT